VVIVGAGFAGLHCAQRLASKPGVSVTLIDRHNYQQFQPLLYQVAAGMLPPDDAAFNLRDVFRKHRRITVVMAEISAVDLHAHSVTATTGDRYCGDVLVLAAGAQVQFFGVPGAEQWSFPMYSVQDAEQLRWRLLEVFEHADAAGVAHPATDLDFVVVGGGATGVETAGAIADVVRRMPKHLFPNIDFTRASVSLVDAGSSVLPPFSQRSREYAAAVLTRRGVRVRLGLSVKEVAENAVVLSDGSRMKADAVVWAGGLTGLVTFAFARHHAGPRRSCRCRAGPHTRRL
jgi:NADH dehydrogenase